jgi:protein arginine kinase
MLQKFETNYGRKMKTIKTLLQGYNKRFDDHGQPVVMSSQISLVRNFSQFKFSGYASEQERQEILNFARQCARKIKEFNITLDLPTLSPLEQFALQEHRIVGKKWVANASKMEAFCNSKMWASIVVNEDEHLRIRVINNGFQLKETWRRINAIDSTLDEGRYAFSPTIGYLTSRLSRVGTGMRASLIVHLPGLVLTGQVQHLMNAVQQIGIELCPIYAWGSKPLSHIFRLSNRHTLGIIEGEEIARLGDVMKVIIEQEDGARRSFLEKNRVQFWDRIGRMYGVLRCCYELTIEDALEMLSWMRLAVDLGILEEKNRAELD